MMDSPDMCLQRAFFSKWLRGTPWKLAFVGPQALMNNPDVSLQVDDSFVALWTFTTFVISFWDLFLISAWHLVLTSVASIPSVLSTS